MAYLRRELYGLALADANKAIQLDPSYTKAYFRRASSNMALGKFKLALKDYDTVFFCAIKLQVFYFIIYYFRFVSFVLMIKMHRKNMKNVRKL